MSASLIFTSQNALVKEVFEKEFIITYFQLLLFWSYLHYVNTYTQSVCLFIQSAMGETLGITDFWASPLSLNTFCLNTFGSSSLLA